VHRTVCLFVSQLLLVLNASIHGGMARLSYGQAELTCRNKAGTLSAGEVSASKFLEHAGFCARLQNFEKSNQPRICLLCNLA